MSSSLIPRPVKIPSESSLVWENLSAIQINLLKNKNQNIMPIQTGCTEIKYLS